MLRFTKSAAFLILALLLWSGCGSTSTTEITASWKKPETPPATYQKIIVLGLSDNVTARGNVEQAIVERLQKRGFNAMQALEVISPEKLPELDDNREETRRILEGIGVDAAIVVSLLDHREDKRWIPGSTYYRPSFYTPYYGSFYGYWYNTYDVVSTPGYYDTAVQVFLESNLYDLTTDELVWSAQSLSEDPKSIAYLSKQFADVMVRELVGSKVIAKP